MDIQHLVKRARLQRITQRARDLDHIREMHAGTYEPPNGLIAPPFKTGTARALAWTRALRNVNTTVPVIITKSLAGIDFGGITWGDATRNPDGVDDALALVNLPTLARDLATELKISGVAACIAHTPLNTDGRAQAPTIQTLHGLNIPYTDPKDPTRITGWYRAIEYVYQDGRLRWWVEVYDWEGIPDGEPITHRVWRALHDPTELGASPDDEFQSTARPRYAIHAVANDGMPTSPILQNHGRIMGLYATELRLVASEEVAAFPMLLTRGNVEFDSIGPAEVIAAAASSAMEGEGTAEWMDPGDLGELREQVALRRDQVREAFSLPGGSLGGQTPSGEALREANRGFMQETRAIANQLGKTATAVANDYLTLLGLQSVQVEVPIDREYESIYQLETLKAAADYNAVPAAVVARVFQRYLGDAYSDDELAAFIEEQEARANVSVPGFLTPADDT